MPQASRPSTSGIEASEIRVHVPGALTATIRSDQRVELVPADGLAVGPLIRKLERAGYDARLRRTPRANETEDEREHAHDGGA